MIRVGSADGETGIQQVGILGHRPGPENGRYSERGRDPSDGEAAYVQQDERGQSRDSGNDDERQSSMRESVRKIGSVVVQKNESDD
ncbi:MAG: hypothetical protein WAM97_19670 [Acidimicrobiales bacterium]